MQRSERETRALTVGVYILAFFVLVASIAAIPQEEWRYMSLSESLALGFSVIVGSSGIALSYYAYVDGKVLRAVQIKKKFEKRQDKTGLGGNHALTFTMAHVKVDHLDRPKFGELKSRSTNNKKRAVKDIVSEARTLTKYEYLETTSAGDMPVEIIGNLTEALGSDFEVSQGSGSGRGSVLYIKRAESSSQLY